jgi:hypothetical protein
MTLFLFLLDNVFVETLRCLVVVQMCACEVACVRESTSFTSFPPTKQHPPPKSAVINFIKGFANESGGSFLSKCPHCCFFFLQPSVTQQATAAKSSTDTFVHCLFDIETFGVLTFLIVTEHINVANNV